MPIEILPMDITTYNEVLDLWQSAPGVGLSSADSVESIGRFLDRNPNLSFVARDGNYLVGTALCGHDGRRGYIHHLAVRQSHRRLGIGRALVEKCLSGLAAASIEKCHLFVFNINQEAIHFWESIGWTGRTELSMMSCYTAEPA